VKKLLVALILAVVLTATLATPAFAGDGNMGGKNADTDPGDPSSWLRNPQGYPIGLINGLWHLGWGPYYMAAWNSGGMNTFPPAYGWAAMAHSIYHIFNGTPPAKPHWAGGP